MTEKEYIDRVCGRIKEIRKNLNLTQADIASQLDMDDGNYRRIESGRTKPSLTTLIRICTALKIEVADLFLSDSELVMFNKLRELPDSMKVHIPEIDLNKESKTAKHAAKISEGKTN